MFNILCPLLALVPESLEKGNYLLEGSKGLLAEVHKEPQQIGHLLSSQNSQFLNLFSISSGGPILLYF